MVQLWDTWFEPVNLWSSNLSLMMWISVLMSIHMYIYIHTHIHIYIYVKHRYTLMSAICQSEHDQATLLNITINYFSYHISQVRSSLVSHFFLVCFSFITSHLTAHKLGPNWQSWQLSKLETKIESVATN